MSPASSNWVTKTAVVAFLQPNLQTNFDFGNDEDPSNVWILQSIVLERLTMKKKRRRFERRRRTREDCTEQPRRLHEALFT